MIIFVTHNLIEIRISILTDSHSITVLIYFSVSFLSYKHSVVFLYSILKFHSNALECFTFAYLSHLCVLMLWMCRVIFIWTIEIFKVFFYYISFSFLCSFPLWNTFGMDVGFPVDSVSSEFSYFISFMAILMLFPLFFS